ncbi:melanoma antigen recognized by T-cells 1 isoform 2-T2 [Dama dama]|uniref:melanoma antigen recognized by T-cells 1 isoform X2 n=1 Tax=Dama dama TaxID=30532 RepID=UPI002A36B959|nr:melanoma antigen recognized by T-cells 1 isoform X2 [Dama dama]
MGLKTRGKKKLKRLRAREAIFTQTAASRRSWSQAGRRPVAWPYKMPREEAHFFHGSTRKGHSHSYVTAEEAAGIGILTVILGILLLLSCWYCRRRSGYRSLKDKNIHAGTQSTLTGRCSHEGLGQQDSKLPFEENKCKPVIPNAPPAYEKLSAEQSPPPYSP